MNAKMTARYGWWHALCDSNEIQRYLAEALEMMFEAGILGEFYPQSVCFDIVLVWMSGLFVYGAVKVL